MPGPRYIIEDCLEPDCMPCSRIRVWATTIRINFPGTRRRQRSGLRCSRRSLIITKLTAAIAAMCPCDTIMGNSINAQQDPTHQAPCVIPKRSASRSAAVTSSGPTSKPSPPPEKREGSSPAAYEMNPAMRPSQPPDDERGSRGEPGTSSMLPRK